MDSECFQLNHLMKKSHWDIFMKRNWTETKKQQIQAQQDEHMCQAQNPAGCTWLWQSLTFAFD